MNATDPSLDKILGYARSGQLDTAYNRLKRISKTRAPESLWLTLSGLCGQHGLMQQVIDCCRKALDINPNSAAACSHLGSASLALHDTAQALHWLQKGVDLQPMNPALRHNFALLLMRLGRYDSAVEQFHESLELRPGAAVTHLMLGNCYQESGNFALAEQYYKLAQDDRETEVAALTRLGNIYANQGYYEQASAHYDRALARQPEDALALGGRADLLLRTGDNKGAYGIVRKLLDRKEATPGVLDVYSRICGAYGSCEEAIEVAEQVMRFPNLSATETSILGYALGNMYRRTGDHDRAFSSFRIANDAAWSDFDLQDYRRSVDRIISVYSPELFREFRHADRGDRQPVFILGMPRSGTSLTEQILSRHSMVHAAGELLYLKQVAVDDLARLVVAGRYPESMPALSVEQLNELAGLYMQRILPEAGDAARVTDKLPGNYHFIGMIRQLFPEARIVHCTRDPRDTLLSIYFQNFQHSQPYSSSLSNIAHVYGEYRRLMRHWRDELGIEMFEMNYESVVADLESHARALVDYCGLPWEDACLDFHDSDRTVKTASYDQVNRPIYTKSVARWKRYEAHLGEALEILAPWLEDADAAQGGGGDDQP